METKDYIGVAAFAIFFALNLFLTQKIYSSKYCYTFLTLILICSLISFAILDHIYPDLKVQFCAFLIFYYGLLLLITRLYYSSLNHVLVRKKFVNVRFQDKDFTHVWISGTGGDIWDKKRSSAPSWLDHFVSLCLFFGPMALLWPTIYFFG
jgi:hypothetical protein